MQYNFDHTTETRTILNYLQDESKFIPYFLYSITNIVKRNKMKKVAKLYKQHIFKNGKPTSNFIFLFDMLNLGVKWRVLTEQDYKSAILNVSNSIINHKKDQLEWMI